LALHIFSDEGEDVVSIYFITSIASAALLSSADYSRQLALLQDVDLLSFHFISRFSAITAAMSRISFSSQLDMLNTALPLYRSQTSYRNALISAPLPARAASRVRLGSNK